MRKIVVLLLAFSAMCVSAQKKIAYVVDLKKEVGSTSWIQIKEGFSNAKKLGADRIIIHENTYGGLVVFADSIRTLILNSPIPVAAFIDNNAASAGALIAIACDSIYMAHGASIGAASVVDSEQTKLPDKYQSYMRSTIRATAEAKGKVKKVLANGDTIEVFRRNPLLAEAMVDENLPSIEGVRDSGKIVTLTTDEAIMKGFCEAKVVSIEEIIRDRWQWDEYEIVRYEPTFWDELRGFLSNPALQAICIMFIIGGIYFELQSPGLGVPSAVAIGAAILYFAPLYLDGLAANWEIIVFIVGVILLLLEIFVIPGFGVAGILGILFSGVGLLLALVDNLVFDFSGVNTNDMGYAIWTVVIGLVGGVGITIYWASRIGAKGFFYRVALNEAQDADKGYTSHNEKLNELQGSVGICTTDMRPVGKITINEELHDATSVHGFLEKGAEVKVVKVEGGLLFVAQIGDSAPKE